MNGRSANADPDDTVYYLAIADPVPRELRLVMGFRDMGRWPERRPRNKRFRTGYVCPVATSEESIDRLFTAWTPWFRELAEELPGETGVLIVGAPRAAWPQHQDAWREVCVQSGLPPPTWLFDTEPDYDQLVEVGKAFAEAGEGDPEQRSRWQRVSRNVVSELAEDAATSVVGRLVDSLF